MMIIHSCVEFRSRMIMPSTYEVVVPFVVYLNTLLVLWNDNTTWSSCVIVNSRITDITGCFIGRCPTLYEG